MVTILGDSNEENPARGIYVPGSPTLLDDVFGRISTIQMQVPTPDFSGFIDQKGVEKFIANIARAFGDNSQIVMARPNGYPLHRDMPKPDVDIALESVVDCWAQDRKLVLTDGDEHRLLASLPFNSFFYNAAYLPTSMEHHQDFSRRKRLESAIWRESEYTEALVRGISSELGYTVNGIDFGFYGIDGGDILSDERTVFLGQNTFNVNLLIKFWEASKNTEKIVSDLDIADLDDCLRMGMKQTEHFEELELFLLQFNLPQTDELLAHLSIINDIGKYFQTYEQNGTTSMFKAEFTKKMSEYSGGRDVVFFTPEGRLPSHLDMFFTPLGNGTVLLGDYSLARDLVVKGVDYTSGNSGPSTQQIDAVNQVYETGFEQVKASLGGYEVVRMPFAHGVPKKWRDMPGLTFNNALIENYRDGAKTVRRAYVGLTDRPFGECSYQLNRMAIAIYRKAGYEVIDIPGSDAALRANGSLRCTSKVLARS